MKESRFIKQNITKWARFEELLKQRKKRDPDELSELFTEVTDDLSYARTFYPNRSVRVYLNDLARTVFQRIYKNRSFRLRKLFRFWQHDLPLVLYASRPELLVSLLVFVLAMCVGALSTEYDEEFPAVILGEVYVRMTETNIESGDPMAVYKGDDELYSFLRITINNIRVAFLTFISGVISSLGTVVIMIYNGVMVGTFQYFFYKHGLFLTSFLTIWIHGTLEISAIIIAGGAGMAMGRGLLFPGTYDRLTAFRMSAQRGIMILISLVPIFIVAGFLEGFVTGHTDLPDALKAGIILTSLAFILLYFVWYPGQVAKGETPQVEREPAPQEPRTLVFYRVRDLGDVFTDMFELYRQNFRWLFGKVLLWVLPFHVLQVGFLFTADELPLTAFWEEGGSYLLKVSGYYSESVPFFLIGIVAWTVLATLTFYVLWEAFGQQRTRPVFGKNSLLAFTRRYGLTILATLTLFKLPVLFFPDLFWLTLLCLPFVLYFLLAHVLGQGVQAALKRARSYLFLSVSSTIGVFLMLFFISMIYYFLISSPILGLYISILDWHFLGNTYSTSFQVLQAVYLVIYMSALSLVLPLILIGFGMQFLSNEEFVYAHAMQERIRKIGTKRAIYED